MKDEYKKLFELILKVIICELHPYDTCRFYTDMNPENKNYTDCYKSHRVSAMNYMMEYLDEDDE
jgi:hypothetical protein